MQETQETYVWSLGWEDPLEEEMATHSSTLAWRLPWTEEPGGVRPIWGRKESDMTKRTAHTYQVNGNKNTARTTILSDKAEFMAKIIKTKKTLNRS